jgi:ATP-dependent Lon protease
MIYQNIKENIEGHAVDWYSDVFSLVFPDVDAKAVNGVWKEQLKESKKEAKKSRKEKKEDDEDSDDD